MVDERCFRCVRWHCWESITSAIAVRDLHGDASVGGISTRAGHQMLTLSVAFGAESANFGLTALLPLESMNTHAWS